MPCPTRDTQVKEDDGIALRNEEKAAMLGTVNPQEGKEENDQQRSEPTWVLADQQEIAVKLPEE